MAVLMAACAPAKAAPETPHAQAAPAAVPEAIEDEDIAEVPAEPPPNAVEEATEVVSNGPLDPEAKKTFHSSPEDEPAEERGGLTAELKNKQYLAGNEKTPQAFYSAIKDIGGGYVGVGSDQAYLLIGWAKPELAWFIDYDLDVVRIHGVYRAFFLARETPNEFLALWAGDAKKEAHAVIEEAYGKRRGRGLRTLYNRHRGWINRRLQALVRRLGKDEVPSFVSDQATYDYVRAMLKAERIRPMVTNLLERKGMVGVGEAARELGVPIRVLYLSNAEEYWNGYTKRYRKNIASLPFDERAVILRTLLVWHVNQDYRYNVQPADNYLEWLRTPGIRTVYHVTQGGPKAERGIVNYFETDGDPKQSLHYRRWEKAAAKAEKSRRKR